MSGTVTLVFIFRIINIFFLNRCFGEKTGNRTVITKYTKLRLGCALCTMQAGRKVFTCAGVENGKICRILLIEENDKMIQRPKNMQCRRFFIEAQRPSDFWQSI